MSAEIMRRAAALMRARAEAATPGPWLQGEEQDGEVLADGTGYAGGYEPNSDVYAMQPDGEYCAMEFAADRRQNAEHIASWHPAVALGVADWLDMEADRCVDYRELFGDKEAWSRFCKHRFGGALAVARSYLGEAS